MTYYESNKQRIKLKYLQRKDDKDFKRHNNLSAKIWYYMNRKSILEKLRRERHKTTFTRKNILITFD